ncbi:hypothetical protein FWF74_03545 [Candidatus Saccharibacteria bacterium]|nr:hypothetical protein [Candidatus Saccharibacteria bacterium]MCL1962848.1 hypothetical protein [Candidatus Saccharibacteria bacterium]
MLAESGYFTADGKCSDKKPLNKPSYYSSEEICSGCKFHIKIGGCALGKYMLRTATDGGHDFISDDFEDEDGDERIYTAILPKGTPTEDGYYIAEHSLAALGCTSYASVDPDDHVEVYHGIKGSSMEAKEDLDRLWKTPGSDIHNIRVEEALAVEEEYKRFSTEKGLWCPELPYHSDPELVPYTFLTREEDEGEEDNDEFEIDKDPPDPEILADGLRLKKSYRSLGWYVTNEEKHSRFRRHELSYCVFEPLCRECKYYDKNARTCDIGMNMLEDAVKGGHRFDSYHNEHDRSITTTIYENTPSVDKWDGTPTIVKNILAKLVCKICRSQPYGADGSEVVEYQGLEGSGIETLQKLNAALRIPDVMTEEWHEEIQHRRHEHYEYEKAKSEYKKSVTPEQYEITMAGLARFADFYKSRLPADRIDLQQVMSEFGELEEARMNMYNEREEEGA